MILKKLFSPRIFNLILIANCAAIFCSTAAAQSSPTHDAHTNNSTRSAGSNFGNNPNLSLSTSENAFVRFDLNSALPDGTAGAQIEKATLKLFIGNVGSPGKVDVYEVLTSWDESTITANNAPVVGNLVATSEQIATERKQSFLVIDLTDAVRQWLGTDGQGAGGIPNYGIVLMPHPFDSTTQTVADLTFDSKENSQTSHEPCLHIQLKDATGGLDSVEHDATLVGDGTPGSLLGVAQGAIGESELTSGAVTEVKLGDGAVTGVKLADGAVSSSKIATPLLLTSADPGFTLSVANTGGGAAITAGGSVNTTTDYRIAGVRMLAASGPRGIVAASNTFAGENAGLNTTPDPAPFSFAGKSNSMFGAAAGIANTTGQDNSFFGTFAGLNNTIGQGNSFFGMLAGGNNTEGVSNAFFGRAAGRNNQGGGFNAFFGADAGFANSEGNFNAFFGPSVGQHNTTGIGNSFFGRAAGNGNVTGGGNTLIGYQADVGSDNLVNATAVGAHARVDQSNSLVLGGILGVNQSSADTRVAIGTTTPSAKLTVAGRGAFNASGAARFDLFNTTSNTGFLQHVTNNGDWQLATTGGSTRILVDASGNVGIGTASPNAGLDVMNGNILVGSPGQGIILKSPDGTMCRLLSIDNAGALALAAVACP